MESVLLKYIPGDELEVRIRNINKSDWLYLYKNIMKDPIITNSIDCSRMEDKVKYRKESIYNKSTKKSEKFVRKTEKAFYIGKYIDYVYKVALSTEEDISNATGFNMYRFKLRASMIIKHWRYDLTCVVSTNNINSLITTRDKLFNYTDYYSHVSQLEYANIMYEVEAEYMGGGKNKDKDKATNAPTTSDIMEVVAFLCDNITRKTSISNDLQAYIYKIATRIMPDANRFKRGGTIKNIANQPYHFNKAQWTNEIFPEITNYYLTDKIDGERGFVIIVNGVVKLLFTNRLLETGINSELNDSIADAEIILDNNLFTNNSKIYLFDILLFEGDHIWKQDYAGRLVALESFTKKLPQSEMKVIELIKSPADIVNRYNTKNKLYETDGLIFNYNVGNYYNMPIYKWKPIEQFSIDFLVMKAPTGLIGKEHYDEKKGHTMYFLFVNIKYTQMVALNLLPIAGYNEIFADYILDKNYFPIQFCPSMKPLAYIYYNKDSNLHGKVYEFSYKCDKNDLDCEWILMRERPDKEFGNDYGIADMTFQGYYNPVSIDYLANPTDKGYFVNTKSDLYKPLTKYNNFVKSELIKMLEGADWVVDLASGKGQDLFTYNSHHIGNILMVDKDRDAIEELNKRKYTINSEKYHVFGFDPKHHMSIYTKIIDLTKSVSEIMTYLKETPLIKADGVVINLALHYIVNSEQSLNKFIDLVDKILTNNGLLIITVFDGSSILKLLNGQPKWECHQDNVVKYSIKHNGNDKDADWGDTIDVLHPFSNGEHYTENMMNINNIITTFTARSYAINKQGSFSTFLPKFKTFNKRVYGELTEDDKTYLSLYYYMVFTK